MVEFPIKNGMLRINPQHVRALWQGNNTATTSIVVGDDEGLTYEVSMPIDEVEKKLKAETSELGLISHNLLQLTTAMRPRV